MADKPPLPHEEVQRILRQLEPLIAERRVVLVGDQAVSFWMRLLQPRSEQLALAEPLTSKDIDFEGGEQAVRRAADLLEGRMKLPTMDDNTPNTGLVQFADADGIELLKTQPLALRQLEVSVICARLWSQVILDSEDLPEDERVRAVLRINERIFRKCVDDRRFRAVVLDLGVNPFDAVLVDDARSGCWRPRV